MSQVPTGQRVRLAVGITGHRGGGGTPGVDEAPVAAALAGIIDRIEAGLATTRAASPSLQIQPTRLHSLLAPGVDQLAAIAAERRGWEIVAPLPFGRRLNVAINAQPHTHADGLALLAGAHAVDARVQARAQAIIRCSERARLFELADRDVAITALFQAMLASPHGPRWPHG